MYVATKGGRRAIENAHRLLREQRRPRPGTRRISTAQILDQQWLAVSRVMTEGSLYDPELAAMAIAQSQGDLVEAVFLVRAFRTTLSRVATSEPLNVVSMRVERRISAAFKDVPGGQVLGPTFDYSHRLIDFDEFGDDTTHEPLGPLAGPADTDAAVTSSTPLSDVSSDADMPRVLDLLEREGLVERAAADEEGLCGDLTREPLSFPAARGLRLQALARGDEGFLLGVAYSTQRGYGSTHPFAGEIRMGYVDLEIVPAELGFPIVVGELEVTECEMINQFQGSDVAPPQFTRGYGLGFGQCERKAMSMALVDRAMRAEELGEAPAENAPAQDVEFVLSHSDSLEASGFVQHLKLPHYVDFQSELVMLRDLRNEWEKART